MLVITGSSARSKTIDWWFLFSALATAEKSTGSLAPSRASATKSAGCGSLQFKHLFLTNENMVFRINSLRNANFVSLLF